VRRADDHNLRRERDEMKFPDFVEPSESIVPSLIIELGGHGHDHIKGHGGPTEEPTVASKMEEILSHKQAIYESMRSKI